MGAAPLAEDVLAAARDWTAPLGAEARAPRRRPVAGLPGAGRGALRGPRAAGRCVSMVVFVHAQGHECALRLGPPCRTSVLSVSSIGEDVV